MTTLRNDLLTINPNLSGAIDEIPDHTLSSLYAASLRRHDEITVLRAVHACGTQQEQADAAGIHGSGVVQRREVELAKEYRDFQKKAHEEAMLAAKKKHSVSRQRVPLEVQLQRKLVKAIQGMSRKQVIKVASSMGVKVKTKVKRRVVLVRKGEVVE